MLAAVLEVVLSSQTCATCALVHAHAGCAHGSEHMFKMLAANNQGRIFSSKVISASANAAA